MDAVITTLGKYMIGLTLFIAGYCENAPPVNELLGDLASNPCNVQCGLLSYIATSDIFPIVGIVLVVLGGAGVILQLFASSFLVPILSAGMRLARLLSFGQGGQSGGEHSIAHQRWGLDISPVAGLAMTFIGLLLLQGGDGAMAAVKALFSVVSGVGSAGMVFLISLIVTVITNTPPCG